MPTQSAADNFTAQQVADAGGVENVWAQLCNRLSTDHLGAIRDGRPYILQIRRHPLSPVLDSEPPQTTFAVRAYFCLANPLQAEVGEVVHPSCMPPSDIEPGPPPQTMIGARRFVRADEGWQRMPDA